MNVEIRRVRTEELPSMLDAMSTAFLERPDVNAIAADVGPLWDLERTWAAFEGDRACGTFRSWATEITVPGLARLPGAAVAGVSVLPTHRRRGILRRLVAAEHAAIRERGEPVGLLYASEYEIYGRFGYGPASPWAEWTVDARATQLTAPAAGTVEYVQTNAEGRDLVKAIFEAWRVRQPGELRRRDFRWDFDLGLRESSWEPRWKGFLAVHRAADGAADGYVRYQAEEKWERGQPRSVVTVNELHALTDEAYAALWRFLLEMDLVATVKADRRSPSERLPWMLTNARAAVSDPGDGLWLRLFDIPRALEARSYERDAHLVLDVVDPETASGRVRVELDAGPDGARCTATSRAPDVTLDVSALGAAYLGGARLRDAVLRFGGADEHRTGALADADTVFRTAEPPWCSTFF